MYYVYMAKLDNVPIYIGKGTKSRYKHCYKKFDSCEVIILEYFESSEEAFEREKELVSYYGRKDLNQGSLLNKSNGGKYIKGSIPWSGKKLSEPHRKNISEGLKKYFIKNPIDSVERKGDKNNFYGKKHSTETKNKISEKRKGMPSQFKGKKHTEESKEKNRLAHIGKPSKKKIIFDKELVKKMRFEDKMTIKELSNFFNCSVYPIKNILREISTE